MNRQILKTAAITLSFLVAGYNQAQAANTESPAAQVGQNPTQPSLATMDEMGEGQFVEVNGAKIFYRDTGEGQPLVLIHGYPLSSDLFVKQQQSLSDQFRVITLDLRGFGRSETPDSDGSIETYAGDVLALMDELEIEQAIIGGHSMGGITTLEMYKQAPERFQGMLLINTTAAEAPIVEQNLWNGFAEQAEAEGVESIVPLLMDEMLAGSTRLNNQELVTYMENVVKQASQDAAIAGGSALAERSDYTELLGSIEVPAMILVGVEDTVTPVTLAQKLKQGIPGSELKIIDSASHAAVIEQPEQVNQAIAEWAGQIGQGSQFGSDTSP